MDTVEIVKEFQFSCTLSKSGFSARFGRQESLEQSLENVLEGSVLFAIHIGIHIESRYKQKGSVLGWPRSLRAVGPDPVAYPVV